MSTIVGKNRVMIRRIGLQDGVDGLEIADHEDTEHRLLPNVGVVEGVCESLHFTAPSVADLKRNRASLREIQEATRQSCMFLTEIEVKVGDVVIFRRVNNVNEDEIFEKGDGYVTLLIPHDDLIARINPDGSLYPLAGNVIIEDREEPVTRVLAAGKPVIAYFDHQGYEDFDDDIEGCLVVLNHKQSAPVADELSAFSGLAYIKRRHINLKLQE